MIRKTQMPNEAQALPGRSEPMRVLNQHFVKGNPIQPPFPDSTDRILFGMGCFWGAEKCFWSLAGVYTTAVGYGAGYTPNPTYEEVCTGMTGHNELVLVVYQKTEIELLDLLIKFWQGHDPTQGMRQGNDMGTQYRSGVYYYDAKHLPIIEQSLRHYQQCLASANAQKITTEILPAPEFYYAEDYHQQYLAKNPGGYCGLGGTGIPYQS